MMMVDLSRVLVHLRERSTIIFILMSSYFRRACSLLFGPNLGLIAIEPASQIEELLLLGSDFLPLLL